MPKRIQDVTEAPDVAEPTADTAAEVIEGPGVHDDPRTPGLRVLEDGGIEYQGKVYRTPVQTSAGCIVPPCWPESPGRGR